MALQTCCTTVHTLHLQLWGEAAALNFPEPFDSFSLVLVLDFLEDELGLQVLEVHVEELNAVHVFLALGLFFYFLELIFQLCDSFPIFCFKPGLTPIASEPFVNFEDPPGPTVPTIVSISDAGVAVVDTATAKSVRNQNQHLQKQHPTHKLFERCHEDLAAWPPEVMQLLISFLYLFHLYLCIILIFYSRNSLKALLLAGNFWIDMFPLLRQQQQPQ